MLSDTFNFGKYNSFTKYGIKVIANDTFIASKRDRSQTIPFRHGRYDYGKKYYENKIISLTCVTEKELTKENMREVVYWLSKKDVLRLWDEEKKYYIGELLTSPEILIQPKRVKQEFTIDLVCEPFAYGEQVIQSIKSGVNKIKYKGTAETPTLIVIKNNNNFSVSNITLTLKNRK